MYRVCYVLSLSCPVFAMSRVCYVLSLLCTSFVMSIVCYVHCLSCLVFVMPVDWYVLCLSCPLFVMSSVCYVRLSRVWRTTVLYLISWFDSVLIGGLLRTGVDLWAMSISNSQLILKIKPKVWKKRGTWVEVSLRRGRVQNKGSSSCEIRAYKKDENSYSNDFDCKNNGMSCFTLELNYSPRP